MLSILVFGFVGMSSLRSNFFPEIDTKLIAIQVVYLGASPEEIEDGIVAKIEENLQGIANIDLVTSTCTENAGSIVVEVRTANKTDQALQDVKNAVDKIASFPAGMEPPIIFKQEPENIAIIFAVTGSPDLHLLKSEARKIELDLRTSDDISQIYLSGFPDEEIEISVRENSLSELGISIAQVAQAVRTANIETTGGIIKGDKEELIIRGRYKEYTATELKDIVIRADRDGRIIRLSDLADVTDKWAEGDPSRNWFNGKPSVSITVNSLNSESILDVTKYVRSYIDAYNTRGGDLKIVVVLDQSVVLNLRIDLLVYNGVIGFLLVLLFLALFLNLRLAFWVALAIPVSFAGMFVFANMAGITINVITLF